MSDHQAEWVEVQEQEHARSVTERCNDSGYTTAPWSDEEHFAVEQVIDASLEGTTLLTEHLTRAIDLSWPGLLALVRLGGQPLPLELVHGRLPDPIPVGSGVLGVDIEEDPGHPAPWHAVLALELATGPGSCAVLLSDCLDREYGWPCRWPPASFWVSGIYCPPVGELCGGPHWEMAARHLSPAVQQECDTARDSATALFSEASCGVLQGSVRTAPRSKR